MARRFTRICRFDGCFNRAARNRTCCNTCRKRDWRERSPIRDAWHNHRHHCRERGIETTLTFDDFAFLMTGAPMPTGNRGDSPTIHRCDNAKPYMRGNCARVPRSLNSAIGARTHLHHVAPTL